MQERDLIFGKDQTQNVVSISTDDNLLYIYKEIDGKVEVETRENKYWLVSDKYLANSKQLKGSGFYKYLKYFDDYGTFVRNRRKSGYDLYSIYNPQEATLVKDGITFFKGMTVNDVSILSFDIEGTGLTLNSKSKTLLISNTFRNKHGIQKKLFCYDDYSCQGELIEAWCEWVREVNPSIICGHNIFSYDLPYLSYCASKDDVSLNLGRDGSAIKYNSKPSQFRKDGSQQYDYYNATIVGREIIDTFFLSMKYDIGRNYTSYNLKQIIKQEGLEKKDRQHYDASQIGKNYLIKEEWEKIKEYAKDDADDALALFDLMIPPFFYYCQSIPKTFQQIINTASGSQLNSFMVRAYLSSNHSLPKITEPKPFEGAVSMGIPGVYDNVRKIDVASLYPSIMIEYKVYDKMKDPQGYLLRAVEYFTEQRLNNKRLAKETGNKYYKHLEQSQKIVINSFYGFLGAPGLLFNSPKNAAFITEKGREIVTKAVEWATGHTLAKQSKNVGLKSEKEEWVLGDKVQEGKGYILVNADTDSISYTNGLPIKDDEFKQEIEGLNSLFSKNIRWENDGTYDKVIVLKAKNYILKNKDKIKYKGSSLTDQKKEPALKELLHKLINCLLTDKQEDIVTIYNNYVSEAYNIKDINRWSVKKTITKPVLNASRKNEKKIFDAMEGEHIQEGDKIWLYSAIDGLEQKMAKGVPQFYKDGSPKMQEKKVLKTPKEWKHDEDKLHYVKRVYDTVTILENVIDINLFIKYTLKSNIKLLENL